MAGASLLALLDDIATLMDDVSVMTKVAARKTAGVLGDDLAVNAEKVTGVAADRELPVVYAVFKGSLLNKAILVPAALLIAAFVPWLITPLLIAGGLFLCYEGFEKVWHSISASRADKIAETAELRKKLEDPKTNPVALEGKRIRGAVRTDFILSAEIIVITLGIVGNSTLVTKAAVLSTIALIMTLGVYGSVALIVKLDDIGLRLLQTGEGSALFAPVRLFGRALVSFAPKLMKILTVVGTLAMFLVGGGILVHGIHALHVSSEAFTHWLLNGSAMNSLTAVLAPQLFAALLGLCAGAVLVLLFAGLAPLMPTRNAE